MEFVMVVYADGSIANTFQCPPACGVALDDVDHQFFQPELLEGVAGTKAMWLAGDATPAPVSVANDDAGRTATVAPINPTNAGAADMVAIGEERPGNVDLTARDVFVPRLFFFQRNGASRSRKRVTSWSANQRQ
jgi:hypothetical protein